MKKEEKEERPVESIREGTDERQTVSVENRSGVMRMS